MAVPLYCALCEDTYTSSLEYLSHERDPIHLEFFEQFMDELPVGSLLCTCCYKAVTSIPLWNEHIKQEEHGDSVVQADLLGKKSVWSVPAVKMEDGSVKVCSSLEELYATGWTEPSPIMDTVIGMNCVQVLKMDPVNPTYHCSVCDVKFDHVDRAHLTGRQHRINVIWNWEPATADRIAKGLDFPKPSTRAKASAEMEMMVKKVFHLERTRLTDRQEDVYQLIIGNKQPEDFSSTGVKKKKKPTDFMAEDVRKEFDLYALIEELSSGPPPSGPTEVDPILASLDYLTEELLYFQQQADLPIELGKDRLQGMLDKMTAIQGITPSVPTSSTEVVTSATEAVTSPKKGEVTTSTTPAEGATLTVESGKDKVT